jgi:hypothetical protein
MKEIKRIDIKEFREEGYLQEANRLFFHPLGLALEVIVDENGNEKLGGVFDARRDKEGFLFSKEDIKSSDFKAKSINIKRKFKTYRNFRASNGKCDIRGIQEIES